MYHHINVIPVTKRIFRIIKIMKIKVDNAIHKR